MHVLLVDNYDSFTFNLFQYLTELKAQVTVVRNDEKTVDECLALAPTHVVISPGPGKPSAAGISKAVVEAFAGKVPVLGVCLGHQCIVEHYGGAIEIGPEIVHGKVSPIKHDSKGVFAALQPGFPATRYHSLVARPDSIPSVLEVTATCQTLSDPKQEVIQAVRHKQFTVEGVQFHPESISSGEGKSLLTNFLNMKGGRWEGQLHQKLASAENAQNNQAGRPAWQVALVAVSGLSLGLLAGWKLGTTLSSSSTAAAPAASNL